MIFTQEDTQQLKEQYPKAIAHFSAYILGKIGAIVSEIEEKDRDNLALSTLAGTPRHLYDFFDEQKIYIEIDRVEETEWWYLINEQEYTYAPFVTRIEAEKEAFKQAFKLLEAKL